MTVSTDDQKAAAARLRCGGHAPLDARARARADSRSLYGYLLDLDDDLAEEFDIRSRVSARQLATAQAARGRGRRGRPDQLVRRRTRSGMGLLVLEGMLAFEMRVGDRTTTELRRRRRPAPGADREGRRAARGPGERGGSCVRRCLALLDAEFADRVRPWPQIGQAMMRRAEPADHRRQRAAGDHRPAAAGGAPRPAAVAPGRTLGAGRAGGNPADAAAHPPPARPAGRGRAAVDLARAGAALARRAGDRAAPATCTCTASLDEHLESLRPAPRAAAIRAAGQRRLASAVTA